MWITMSCLVALSIVHYVLVTSRQGWISAEAIAVASMLVMMLGYAALPGDTAAFEPFFAFSALCYAACVLGMLVIAVLRPPQERHPRPIPEALWKPTAGMVVVLILTGLIGVAYYRAAGSIPFVSGLQNVFLGADNDIRTQRLDTYKGSQYLAPGYVNQVKNVIFPALAAVVATYLWVTRRLLARIAAGVLGLIAVVFLFGTGQRTFGILFALALAGAYAMVSGGLTRRIAVRVGVGGFVLYVLATAALGRSAGAAAQSSGLTDALGVYLSEALQRVYGSQQGSAIAAETVVGNWTIPLLSDWWSGLLDYLPGQSTGNSISGTVGAFYTGGSATTMPPSSVTSARLNLTAPGALVFFFVWGMVLALVSRFLLATKGGSPIFFIGSAGTMVVMGTWIADSPFTQLQTGLVAFIALAVVGRAQYTRYLRKQETASAKNASDKSTPPKPALVGASRARGS